MNSSKSTVIVGLGEVGGPLLELLSQHYQTIGVDLEPLKSAGPVDVLHICYPFQIDDFIKETARYIEHFKPALTVIDSTVAVGTTRAVAEATNTRIAYSPVRGKHARMLEELKKYRKFVGGVGTDAAKHAASHFEGAGLQTEVLSTAETCELAKLTETTYFGLMIAWAQEVERYCDIWSADYGDVVSFYEEIGFFPPVKYFPGVIGGHCVMPNIEILKNSTQSELLDAIESSNLKKVARESAPATQPQLAEPKAL